MYPTASDPVGTFIQPFRFQDLVAEQSVEWQPILKELILTQAFSQFIDQRLSVNKLDRGKLKFSSCFSIHKKYCTLIQLT